MIAAVEKPCRELRRTQYPPKTRAKPLEGEAALSRKRLEQPTDAASHGREGVRLRPSRRPFWSVAATEGRHRFSLPPAKDRGASLGSACGAQTGSIVDKARDNAYDKGRVLFTFNFQLSTSRLALLLLTFHVSLSTSTATPPSFEGWPDDPYWMALTNHIGACYRAVCERGRTVGKGDFWCEDIAPTFICPYLDYVRLGEAMDDMAGAFVDSRLLDADGGIQAWLDAHPEAVVKDDSDDPDATFVNLPTWTAEGLRLHCGVDRGWRDISVLTSWAACDRSIQGKVEAACRLLSTTSMPATPRGTMRRGIWTSFGADSEVEGGEDVYDLAESFPRSNLHRILVFWPGAYSETAPVAGVEGACPQSAVAPLGGLFRCYNFTVQKPWGFLADAVLRFRSDPDRDGLSVEIDSYESWCTVTPNASDFTEWSGRLAFVAGSPGGCVRDLSSITCPMEYFTDPWGFWSLSCWKGDVHLQSLSGVKPYVVSYRCSVALAMEYDCSTNIPCCRDLYAIGGPHPMMHTDLDSHPLDWRPEVGSLGMGRFTKVFEDPLSTESNSVCSLFATPSGRPYGGAEDAYQRGWNVTGGFWLLRWAFANEFPEIVEDQAPVPPDSDLDCIVNVPGTFFDPREPYGSAQFLPDWQEPFVRVPVLRVPYLAENGNHPADLLPVHLEFTAGRGEGLPYLYAAAHFYECQTNDWLLGLHLTCSTRIVEDVSCTTPGREEHLVSLVRPHGRMVVFRFVWRNGEFDRIGCPIGRDAGRMYVLEQSPSGGYTLRFPDGVWHRFQHGGLSRVGRDPDGAEEQVSLSGSRGHRWESLTSPGGLPFIDRVERDEWSFVGGIHYVPVPVAVLETSRPFVSRVAIYARTNEPPTRVSLEWDGAGRLVGMTKTGFGAGTGFSLGADRGEIVHPWGTERMESHVAGDSGTQSRVCFTTPDTSWFVEWDLNGNGQPVRHAIGGGAGSVEERWNYLDEPGRFDGGTPKAARVREYIGPDGSATTYAHAPDTGWPVSIASSWNGLSSQVRWGYSHERGDATDAAKTLEMPRSSEWWLAGSCVSKRLASVETDASYPYQRHVSTCRLPTADAGWADPESAVVIRTVGMSGVISKEQAPWGGWSRNVGATSFSFLDDAGRYDMQRWDLRGHPAGSEARVSPQPNPDWYSDCCILLSSNHVVSCDALGRPLETVYNDGTRELTTDWDLFGPCTVVRRDLTTVHVERDALGRVVSVSEPDFQRSATVEANPLGLETIVTMHEGDATRVFSVKRDLLGHPLEATDSLGTTRWTDWEPLGGGAWSVTLERPGYGAVYLELERDGAVRKQTGPGAQTHFAVAWRMEGGSLRRRTTILSPSGSPTPEWTETEYDFLGRPCRFRQAGVAGATELAYDAAWNPASLVDPAGATALATHDERHEPRTRGVVRDGTPGVLEPGGTDFLECLHRSIGPTASTRSLFAYPVNGSSCSSLVATATAAYDGRSFSGSLFGRTNVVEATEFSGPAAFSVSAASPAGSLAASFGPLACSATELDPNGGNAVTRSVVCEPDGSEIRVDDSRDGLVRFLFDEAGRLGRVDASAKAGEDLDIRYKPGTWLPERVERGGEAWTATYHPNGLPATVRRPGEPPVSYTWDPAGRLETATTTADGQPVVRRWVRDARTGRFVAKTVNGVPVEGCDYHADGRPKSLSRPGSEVELHYGVAGELEQTVETSETGTETVLTAHDRMGRVAGQAVAGGISEAYARELDGGVTVVSVDGGGLVPDHNLAYDRAQADGATVGWTLGGPAVAARTLSTSRDAAFRTATLSDGPVSAVYAYGPSRGGVTSVVVRVHGADVLRHSFAWHRGLGVRTNLAATLAAPGTPPVALPCFGLPRDPGTNRIVRVLREDGSRREVEYEDGRLTRWTCRRADGSTDAARSFAYAYDGAGDVLRGGPVNDAGEGRAAFAPGDLNLHVERRWNAVDLVGYAPADAAVTANGVPAARDGERFRFVFPLADPSPASTTNLLVCAAVPQPDGTERYAELPVLLRLPAMPETIAGDTAGVTASDSLTEYRYDARGRLRRVTDKLASVPRYDSVYDYYPDGRRARKTVSVWQDNAWQPSSTHQYLYDRWNLVEEHTHTPIPPYSHTRYYSWGLDLAGLETGTWSQDAGGIGGLLAITEVAGTSTNVFLPACDQVGTVMALVAAVTNNVTLSTPAVVARYEYSPYGELIERTGPYAASCPFGFQSKYRDVETGFWYFGHRFFDSRCAQWLTHDPLREEGGFNLAAFCGGDPVGKVDPWGLCDLGTIALATLVYFISDTLCHAPEDEIAAQEAAILDQQESVQDASLALGIVAGGAGGALARGALTGARIGAGTQWFLTAEASALSFSTTRNLVVEAADDSPGVDYRRLMLNSVVEGQLLVLVDGGAGLVFRGSQSGAWQFMGEMRQGAQGLSRRIINPKLEFLDFNLHYGPGGSPGAANGLFPAAAAGGTSTTSITLDRVAAKTTVYRVEGLPNTRILLGEGGQVSVQGDQMLFLNFGDKARAEQFLTARVQQRMPGAQMKSFEVPQSFLDELRANAVPESMAKQFPGLPLLVDPTKAADQFGLRPDQIQLLRQAIVQGSGRTH